jgi:DNA modification methylase
MAGLAELDDDSVHCCITSPPYWGLRDYQTGTWEGGDPNCDHRSPTMKPGRNENRRTLDGSAATNTGQLLAAHRAGICGKCGARKVDHQIGIEPTFQDHLNNLVKVFREVRRVLRPDGTLWLNYGDAYANDGKWGGETSGKQAYLDDASRKRNGRERRHTGLKPKDLIGKPWRVAFALQADGWFLRSDIIWAKPNPMPESVRDRPTKSHEYVFLFAKSERYFYDAEAIREHADWGIPNSPESIKSPYGQGYTRRASAVDENARPPGTRPHSGMVRQSRSNKVPPVIGAKGNAKGFSRNKRSVWTVATAPFPEAHFATFPPALIEPMILAGTSEKGCCSNCGAPWVRETTTSYDNPGNRTTNGPRSVANRKITSGFAQRLEKRTSTTGWRPSCSCDAAIIPCIVLDPFMGAGTTGVVADRLNRVAIGIELSPKYARMAKRRIARDRLERRAGTMADVGAAELEPTPLEALMVEGGRTGRCPASS